MDGKDLTAEIAEKAQRAQRNSRHREERSDDAIQWFDSGLLRFARNDKELSALRASSAASAVRS